MLSLEHCIAFVADVFTALFFELGFHYFTGTSALHASLVIICYY